VLQRIAIAGATGYIGGRLARPNGRHEAPLAAWLLFAPQHRQLGVGSEDLARSVLKGPAGRDAPADVVWGML
jgi:hypothetical protein